MTQQQLATKLDFKRQAWAQLETSEARGAISLYSLRRAADALGYDFVYFLVPKDVPPAGAEAAVSGLGEEVEPADRLEVGGGWEEPELPTELR
jgi:transcriptional regulator with XRE-family HTH domain